MNLRDTLLALLRERGTLSRAAIERYAEEHGWSAGSADVTLWQLKRCGLITHVQRGGRYRRALYGIGEGQ